MIRDDACLLNVSSVLSNITWSNGEETVRSPTTRALVSCPGSFDSSEEDKIPSRSLEVRETGQPCRSASIFDTCCPRHESTDGCHEPGVLCFT